MGKSSTSFEKGNKLWQRAENPGRPRSYEPDTLWDKAVAYFNWCDQNPEVVEELGGKNFTTNTREVIHAPTIMEFTVFANINPNTWFKYAKNPEYSDVCSQIQSIMFSTCFRGASSGQLNANIISRHLGLVDKKEIHQEINNVVLVIPDNGRAIAAPPIVNLIEGEDFLKLPVMDEPL